MLQVASETQPEYASSIWDKSVKCNINKIEAVQRCAAHFTCRDYQRTSSVSATLQKPKWESLQERRARSRVLLLYRTRNDLVALPAAEYVQPVPSCTRGFETKYIEHKHLQSILLSSHHQFVVHCPSTFACCHLTASRPV